MLFSCLIKSQLLAQEMHAATQLARRPAATASNPLPGRCNQHQYAQASKWHYMRQLFHLSNPPGVFGASFLSAHLRRHFVGLSSDVCLEIRQAKIVGGLASSSIAWYYQRGSRRCGVKRRQIALRSTETSGFGHESEYERRASRTSVPTDESADALRRRADALLDEMMLNGVDIAVGEGPDNGFVSLHPAAEAVLANGFAENGLHTQAPVDDIAAYRPSVTEDKAPTLDLPQMKPEVAVPPVLSSATPATPDALFAPLDAPLPLEARLVPAEERYPRPSTGVVTPVVNGYAQPGSAVRRQSASLASTMTVGGRTTARSALLPRTQEVDVDTAAQEIMALASEIAAALPVGHEAAERSRHLLNKAQNILQSDPSRTAEVDYYLQQVRRIVQRTRQTRTYSAIYHRRLLIYLTGWVALAVVAVTARYLLEEELYVFLEELFWLGREAPWVQFGPMVIGAFFAGALGGALSVLLNMRRHAAQEYGYFDRKYGLRGLTLPLLGALLGVLLALVWATVSYFLMLSPANVWVDALPAMIAFLVGFGQEWLYGAR